eukprot:scaffold15813_cov63-Phaeocystis_antarctica.AAC.1
MSAIIEATMCRTRVLRMCVLSPRREFSSLSLMSPDREWVGDETSTSHVTDHKHITHHITCPLPSDP